MSFRFGIRCRSDFGFCRSDVGSPFWVDFASSVGLILCGVSDLTVLHPFCNGTKKFECRGYGFVDADCIICYDWLKFEKTFGFLGVWPKKLGSGSF